MTDADKKVTTQGPNFALLGAAGYVARRHLDAIRDVGGTLVAAMDPHDSVGVLDSYFPSAAFFTQVEKLERYLQELRRTDDERAVDYVTICTPNDLHDPHIRLALRNGAHALCEKPLVLRPGDLDALSELEQSSGRRVFTVLQLRVHPDLIALRETIQTRRAAGHRADVVLSYITRRGAWYHASWKVDEPRSGGVAMNIGIHFFDLLMWLFGPAHENEVHLREPQRAAGRLALEGADVRWFLSIDGSDRPDEVIEAGKPAFRSITIDGEELEFSNVFTSLHTTVYERTLAGRGFGIEDARPAIELVDAVRTAPVREAARERVHAFVGR